MNEIWLLILFAGVLTYLARISGHLLLSRLDRVPRRLEATLNAVPAAVLTTLVTPVLVNGGWPERLAILVVLICTFRLPLLATVAIGAGIVIVARAFGY
ncbi:AzlD family protein [Consotaella aegiceratis]|uniref:AzlD family protein n=1 Tax=Consotaella aegiceratis TaxID=3097961 RepID=UPI002F4207C7